MIARTQKLKAGVFVLVSMGLVAATLAVVAGVKILRSESTYSVEFTESVSGLSDGAQVTYKGVPIGRVRKIRFMAGDISRIEVVLGITNDIVLRAGTKATIRTRGITGVNFIELSGGDPSGPPLGEDSVIESDRSLLGAIETSLPEVLSGFKDALLELKKMLGPDSQEKLHLVLDDIHAVFGENREKITASVERLERAISSLESAAGDVRAVVSQSRPDVESAVADFKSAAAKAREIATGGDVDATVRNLKDASANVKRWTEESDPRRALLAVEAAVSDLRSVIAKADSVFGDNRANVEDAILSLKEGAVAIEDLLKQVRDNPGLLLAKPRPEREP